MAEAPPNKRPMRVLLVEDNLGDVLLTQKAFQAIAPCEIQVSAEQQGEAWRISVRDNGIGIPADQRERIFQIFCRLHAEEGYEGTGVGLAICERVVKNHHGRIWVEAAPGGGSVFYFTLPHAQVIPQKKAANE